MSNYNFAFYCRESRQDRNGLAAIELSLSIDGKRLFIPLPRKANAAEFKKSMSSRKNNEIKDYTALVRQKINKYINEMIYNNIAITAQSLKDYFMNGGVKVITLSSILNEFYKYVENKTIRDKKGNVRKYELSINKFQSFLNEDIELNKITFVVIEEYKAMLMKEFEETTVAQYLKRLKALFTFAVNLNKMKINPFYNVTIPKAQKEVEKLDNYDVEKIENKEFNNERLNKVKDLFLFQCYTALSYADMALVTKEDINLDINVNLHYIKKERLKTGVLFFTVLNDKAMNILHKYDYKLPILSNQKYNSYLKEIGDICNITKPLHTHLARHTAATRLLNDGMPIEIVSKILGHTNTRQTQHYAHLLDTTVLKTFSKVYNKVG